MSVDLPTPIAIYIAAENHGDTEALAECFVEDAIVETKAKPSRIWPLSNDGRRTPSSLRISFAQRDAQRTADGNYQQSILNYRLFPTSSFKGTRRVSSSSSGNKSVLRPIAADKMVGYVFGHESSRLRTIF